MANPSTMDVIFQALAAVTNNQAQGAPFIVNWDFGTPTLAAGVIFYDGYFQATTSGATVPLPEPTVFAVFIQNLSATLNLTLNITPGVGGSATTTNLGPNGLWVLLDPPEVGFGVTSIVLTGNTATVPAMVLVAF